jgi:acyl dehydratase
MSVSGNELKEGLAHDPWDVGPLSRTDFVRYQGASGDFNPVHHDEVFATGAGYPSVFSVGMLQAGILATYATNWLGPENVRRFKVRFSEQVWPGDTLTCAGTVVKKYEEDGDRKVDLELTCTRQTGGAAIEGSATFVVP